MQWQFDRTTVSVPCVPEIVKAQSVTPQTTKYRYRTVISDQWIHWKFKKKSGHSNITFVNIWKLKLTKVNNVKNNCTVGELWLPLLSSLLSFPISLGAVEHFMEPFLVHIIWSWSYNYNQVDDFSDPSSPFQNPVALPVKTAAAEEHPLHGPLLHPHPQHRHHHQHHHCHHHGPIRVPKNACFRENFPKYGRVRRLIPKPPPQNRLFNPNFTFHVSKSHKTLGWVGFKDLGKFSQKREIFLESFFWGLP